MLTKSFYKKSFNNSLGENNVEKWVAKLKQKPFAFLKPIKLHPFTIIFQLLTETCA